MGASRSQGLVIRLKLINNSAIKIKPNKLCDITPQRPILQSVVRGWIWIFQNWSFSIDFDDLTSLFTPSFCFDCDLSNTLNTVSNRLSKHLKFSQYPTAHHFQLFSQCLDINQCNTFLTTFPNVENRVVLMNFELFENVVKHFLDHLI